jgi:hypothetical protein
VLTGLPAGARDASGRFPASSVFGRVERRIIEIAEKLREAEGHMVAEAAEAMEEAAGADPLEGTKTRSGAFRRYLRDPVGGGRRAT